jgi:chemotaxis protein histidine kinase CheA
MPVFRGLGGAGSSDDDATISAVTTQAQIATTKANEASASANSAASSSATAVTKADEASTSATNAANSETAAASSASTASTAATAAGNAQTAAEAAQTAAEAAQTAAETAETNAETAETNAVAAQGAAETAETNAESAQTAAEDARDLAEGYRDTALSHKNDAETAQGLAETARDQAVAAQEAIDGFFLGTATSNPTVDLNGDPVTAGDWYFNSVDNSTRIYDGSNWNTINPDLVGDLTPQLGGSLDLNSNDITGTGNVNITGNISLTGVVDGRDVAADGTKLDGVETGATADQTASEILAALLTVDGAASGLDADMLDGNQASAFATSAQGALASSAVQPSDNVSVLTNDAGYLTSFTETNNLSVAVTWANVPDVNITQSSVTQHQAALSIAGSQITGTIDGGTY